MSLKKKTILLLMAMTFIWVAVAEASVVPIVKLLFDDAGTSTVNLGSFGGIQLLAEVNGQKTLDSPPPVTFDSGMNWSQTGFSTTGTRYADYTLPNMSKVTVAFWYKSTGNDGGFTNIFANNYGVSGSQFAAFRSNYGDVNLLGPRAAGDGMITISGAAPLSTWVHIAYTYDATDVDPIGVTKVYINGILTPHSGTWVGAVPASSSSEEVAFGYQEAGSVPLYGKIDNFFIFDTVLAQGQIQGLMTANELPTPTTCQEVIDYGLTSVGDLNFDCYVDLRDFAMLAGEWMLCVDLDDPACTLPESIWIDNTHGIADVVLPGFTALSADSSNVSMWGRSYQFGGSLMPQQIANQGVNMLASPINWYLKVGASSYALNDASSTLVSSSPTRAVYETSGSMGGLTVNGTVTVEYDGFMKFELEFDPGVFAITADQLYMEIPFTPSVASNFFHPTRRTGEWDSTWADTLNLPYTNVITIGTPDICLQWLTESDEHYYPVDNSSAIEAFNDGSANVFRTNIIAGSKTISEPFNVIFALQAGPVKARPTDWRTWTMDTTQYNLDPGLYHDVQYKYDWWARSPGEPIPRNGFPEDPNSDFLKDEINFVSSHFAGIRHYDEVIADKRLPEWQRHESEWVRVPTLYEDEGLPGWYKTYVDTDSSWSQWHLYNLNKLFSSTGTRGVYYDNFAPGVSMNELTSSGYIDEGGSPRPTNPIFSQRELHRRAYAIVKQYRPDDGVVILHTASSTLLPIVAFSDIVYDGEIMIWQDLVPPDGDYFQTYKNSLFQAIFQCKQFGLVPGFHDMTTQQLAMYPEVVGPDYLLQSNQRKLWSILLTHDIHMHAGFRSGEEADLNEWKDSFGIAESDVEFHSYWEQNPAADVNEAVEPESNLWASAYSRSDKVLVIVVRDAPNNYTGLKEIEVELDRTKLGLPAGPLSCTSFESMGVTPMGVVIGDTLKVDVNANDFAGVIIQP